MSSYEASWTYCATDIGVHWGDGRGKEIPNSTLRRVHCPLDASPAAWSRRFHDQEVPYTWFSPSATAYAENHFPFADIA